MTYERFVERISDIDAQNVYGYLNSFGGYHWLWTVLFANDSVHSGGFEDFVSSHEDERDEILDGLMAMGAIQGHKIFAQAYDSAPDGDTSYFEALDQEWFGAGYKGFEDAVVAYAREHAPELYASLTDTQKQPEFNP